MTTYSVSAPFTTDGNSGHLAIRATTLDVRIIGFEGKDHGDYGLGTGGSFKTAPASTISGGTVVTPYATHAGAPSATAQARSFATITPDVVTTVGYFNTGNSGGNTTWKPMGDLILNPGAVFNVQWGYGSTVVYFEELRLSWSY